MSPRKTGAKRLCFLILCAIGVPAAAAGAAELQLLGFESVTPSESAQPSARGAAPGMRLRLAGASRQFDLLLEPNTALLPGGRTGGTEALRGTLPGMPGSWARLTRRNGRYRGIYSDGTQVYIVEQAGDLAGTVGRAAGLDPGSHVVYRLADLTIHGALFEGDTLTTTRTGADLLADVAADSAAAAVLATKRLDVALVADSELVARDGSDTDARAIDRLNIVDGIFSSQVGVQIRLASLTHVVSATAGLTSTDASTLLAALKSYRNGSGVQQAAGVTHLLTGRDLDGQTVGIAYLDSLCSRSFAASLSEARIAVSYDALITAHELGHVFGAPHDGDAAAACASTPETFLMAPRLNGSSTFSDCSLQQIARTVASASCLAQVDAADAAVSVPTATALAQDQPTTAVFTVSSVGNATVNGVTVTVTPPPDVTINGGSVSGGSCTLTNRVLGCTLGDLPTGVNRDVQLKLTGTAAGTSAALVQLAAANDGLARNNRTTLALVTAPGADLALAMTSDATAATVGGTITAHLTLRNLGLAAAPDAKLAATLPPGLTLVAASASGQGSAGGPACAVTAGALDCQIFLLVAGAQAGVDLTLRVDGTGALAVTASLQSATLADPQPDNNAASLTLSGVAAAAQPAAGASTAGGDGGGGGGSGAGLLPLLLLGLALRQVAGRPRGYCPVFAK